MRKVIQLLEYNMTSDEKEALLSIWIINWCWWKWWVNFSEKLNDYIVLLPKYNQEKWRKLIEDIKEFCHEHDIDYRFKKWFYYANYKFAYKIFKLLKSWVCLNDRIWLFILVFTLLNKYWEKYYK